MNHVPLSASAGDIDPERGRCQRGWCVVFDGRPRGLDDFMKPLLVNPQRVTA